MHHSVTYYEHTTSKENSRTSDQFIIMTSIGKENEAVNAYLIKNSKGGGGGRKKKGGAGVGVGEGGPTLTSSRKDWVEFYGCIK